MQRVHCEAREGALASRRRVDHEIPPALLYCEEPNAVVRQPQYGQAIRLGASHEFDATYEAGKSYSLTVGVIGGGGASGYLLLELGDKLVLEDASGNLLLEG